MKEETIKAIKDDVEANLTAKELLAKYVANITEYEAKELLIKFKEYLEPHSHYSDEQYLDAPARQDKQYKG